MRLKETIEKDKILPTKKFKQAMIDVTKNKDPFMKLKEIIEQFGKYIVLQMIIGGEVQEIIKSNLSDFIKQKAYKFNSLKNEKNRSSHSQTITAYFRAFGKDRIKYEVGDLKGWISSLNNYTKWEIIEYDKIESIFNILDEELC